MTALRPARIGGNMNAENNPVDITTVSIGDTTYIVEHVISVNARETAYDKVKRLILNDTELSGSRKAS